MKSTRNVSFLKKHIRSVQKVPFSVQYCCTVHNKDSLSSEQNVWVSNESGQKILLLDIPTEQYNIIM